MITFKKTGKAVLFVLLTILIGQTLNFLLVDDREANTRAMLRDLYANADKIETLFLGSSHCYMSVDPEIVDRKLSTFSFNGGSPNQMPDTSYYLLREALDCGSGIKTVYMEVYCDVLRTENAEPVAASYYFVLDHMRPTSLNRYRLLAEAGEGLVPEFLIPARRYLIHFFTNWKEYPSLWKAKLCHEYENSGFSDEYRGRGFVSSKAISAGPGAALAEINSAKPISDLGLNSLQRMVKLCRDKGIKLILFAAPMPCDTLQKIKNYQVYTDAVRQFAEENDLEFWDFSLYKDNKALALSWSVFTDSNHLNGAGAEVFTNVLCDTAAQSAAGQDVSRCFYGTLAEKLAYAPDKTVPGGTAGEVK